MRTTSRRGAGRATLTRDGNAKPGRAVARSAPGALTLDELLAEPMVQQLMYRDGTDEMAVRRLWEHVAATRPVQTPRCMPPLPEADDELGHLLHETDRLWRRRCEKTVHARIPGMTCARCAVLLKLEQPENLNQVALAHSLDVAPITLARLLDRLEAADLVSRLPDPHDRRSYLVTSTAKARPLIIHIYDIISKIQNDACLGLSDTETNQLCTLLRRIRSNLLVDMNQPPSVDPAQDSKHA